MEYIYLDTDNVGDGDLIIKIEFIHKGIKHQTEISIDNDYFEYKVDEYNIICSEVAMDGSFSFKIELNGINVTNNCNVIAQLIETKTTIVSEVSQILPIKKKKTQVELSKEILDYTDINIVTCGNCGVVLLHKIDNTEIECPKCEFKSEPCDFPDLTLMD